MATELKVTASVFIPEDWEDGVQIGRGAGGVVSQLVNRELSSNLQVGNKVNVSIFPEFTVEQAVDDGKENNFPAAALTTVQLEVTKHDITSAFFVDKDLRQVQNAAQFTSSSAASMGLALAKELDTNLIAQAKTDASSFVNQAGVGVGITADSLQALTEAYDDVDAPAEDRFLVVGASGKRDIGAIDKFSNSSNTALDQSDMLLRFSEVGDGARKNFLGNFYGINVFWSSLITAEAGSPTGFVGISFHGDALALGLQEEVNFQSEHDLRRLGVSTIAEQTYGMKGVRVAEIFKFGY